MKGVMHFSLRATSLLVVIGLAACGGLEKTDITPDRLMYGKLATFTVNGPNLDKGITFNAPSCSGIAEVVASAAPTQKVYTCTPAVTGPMTVAVVGGGVVLRSMTLTIAVPQVTLATSLGDMVMELDPVKAPLSVNNFLQYVNSGFYSKLLFHRVISGFMIQAGGFDATLAAVNTRPPITLESNNGLINLRGTLAMARTDVPNSGTSQFYINVIDNPPLDYVSATQPGYAVFGKVVTGMAVADAIGAVPTGVRNGMNDVPLTDVVILSATQTQ
jgi:peptidyl-prolyl cis-trans isomerase A (cyclophilin A)